MNLSQRDRRALGLLGLAILMVLVLRYVVFADRQPSVVSANESIPMAERRLNRLTAVAATIPAKLSLAKKISAEAVSREKGIIQAPTAQQAQAHLLETIRRVAKAENIDVRGGDFHELRLLGNEYGEAAVSVNFECHIEDLVNFLADLTKESELLATNEVRVVAGNQKTKMLLVRLTLAGVVPRSLVPAKKGFASF